MDIQKLRTRLKEFISFDEGASIRLNLHCHALSNYSTENSNVTYLQFINANECKFEIIHPQSQNHPYYMGLFTVASQWVYGDCAEECIDKAIKVSSNLNSTLKRIWKLPDHGELI